MIYLRGNRFINYEQLGLKYKLYSCAVLFNRGLCYIYLQQKDVGMKDLSFAAREKETEEHDVIDEAIQEEAEASDPRPSIYNLPITNMPQGYTVFSIGVGTLYRPNNAKVKNLKSKDYLGKARLIAAAEQPNTYLSSSDPKKAALAAATERAVDDRAPESISYGASNLVKSGLHSRTRQQSAPPVNRNMFPPTPPPETENKTAFIQSSGAPSSQSADHRPTSTQSAQHVRSEHLRPEPLKLQKSSFTSLNKELPRIGTTRTASEPRGPTRRVSGGREHPRRLAYEATPARPHSGAEADIDEYPEELLEMDPTLRKQPSQSSTSTSDRSDRSLRPSSRPRPRSRSRHRREHPSIVEEDETADGELTGSSVDGFEMLHNAGGGLSQPPPPPLYIGSSNTSSNSTKTHTRARSSSRRATSRTRSRRPPALPEPELKNMRIKVHYHDDTRYIMQTPDVAFEAFREKIRDKFGVRADFKLKIKDEGDLITMGDRDDWDMAISAARREMLAELRRNAAAEEEYNNNNGGGSGSDSGMGKMEVWVTEVT